MERVFEFDLSKAWNSLHESIGKSYPETLARLNSLLHRYEREGHSFIQPTDVFDALIPLLTNRQTSLIAAEHIKPLLPMLVARRIDKYLEKDNGLEEDAKELVAFTFCLSCLSVRYKNLQKYLPVILNKCFHLSYSVVSQEERCFMLSTVLYNVMVNDPILFSPSIKWDSCISLLQQQPAIVHLNSWRAFLTGHGVSDSVGWLEMCCSRSKKWAVTESDFIDWKVNGNGKNISRQILDTNITQGNYPASGSSRCSLALTDANKIDGFVNVCGVILPTVCTQQFDNNFSADVVYTESTKRNLRSIALGVLCKAPVMIEGDIGSGKTFLVEQLAYMIGHRKAPGIVKLQLGSQTDSKTLLGTYVCTKMPGEFRWQEGVLTQAVKHGSWIVLEDIDSAPPDVLSLLVPLIETNCLTVPGHGSYKVISDKFQIFATRRLGTGQLAAHSFHSRIEDLFTKVIMETPTREELIKIVSTRFSNLHTVAPKLVDIYSMLSYDPVLQPLEDTGTALSVKEKRLYTTRDFMKWCGRITTRVKGSTTSVMDDIFPEAVFCFCSPLADQEARLMVAQAIGAKMNVNKETVTYYMTCHKPVVERNLDSFVVGRVSLTRNMPVSSSDLPQVTNYAFTKHSLLLLEQLATCVAHNEPVLLVGETGCGKTATIQYLAAQCGHSLSVVNMSQQSDVADLLGGFKPVSTRQLVEPLRKRFEELFISTFSRKQNVKFLGHIQQAFVKGQWDILLTLMRHCIKSAAKRNEKDEHQLLDPQWQELSLELDDLKKRIQSEKGLVFAFIEGVLIKAMRDGGWILLDEVNLAASETLECLSSVLESKEGSVLLTERGDIEPIVRHSDFRLFACMNPATDIGKKDLPSGIRNRFTEVYVDEMSNTEDLKMLVTHYLKDADITSPLVDGIVKFYKAIQVEAQQRLVDGTGHKPHYSLRTLCRALEFATSNRQVNQLRAVYEGMCMSFLTQLHRTGHMVVESLIQEYILCHCSNKASILSQAIPCPGDGAKFRRVGNYWITKGTNEPYNDPKYIITQAVKANLNILSRVVSGRKCPVLLQGETSVGKTSMIQYLAKLSGNHCVRINNHEHTDIQEYIGCYAADKHGKLVFKEGVLIDAMRKGYWIILDELNLAPTDVLEALNRLLDDNRELYIAETQETVKAHERFMLFATQNPPGHYSGRKMLSRAFRNRFVELHFDEIPGDELRVILHKRCDLPQSYCKKFVDVMLDLQARRKSSGIFAGKHGFITLRDLFRWADRYRLSDKDGYGDRFYDWEQQLCEDGYMLLAGRCRKQEEALVIQNVIEDHFKRKVNPERLFGDNASETSLTSKDILDKVCHQNVEGFSHLVWTKNLRRMAVLVGRALRFNEPVLLVGETGCGKTTICQLFSKLSEQTLYTVNCHMHTESSDFLGGLRPVRERSEQEMGKLFEWQDGPLLSAMKDGSYLLIDEISLADDSVLERLNSVLENERTLVLAEKGGVAGETDDEVEIITANKNFRVIGTMNPGGDFGKKELSPALRNRFVEIWCPVTEERNDLVRIIDHNVNSSIKTTYSDTSSFMMDFVEWIKEQDFSKRSIVSIRDILSWVHFINKTCLQQPIDNDWPLRTVLTPEQSLLHGCSLVFIDAIGQSSGTVKEETNQLMRKKCLKHVESKLGLKPEDHRQEIMLSNPSVFGIKPFFINRGPLEETTNLGTYSLGTTSTCKNAVRVLRGLQLDRPILLEGSPGAGKTSLVSAIAKASGHPLVRINLSEQTDIADLFGADLPKEGGKAGEFTWRDGPFLKALKEGYWVMLDELNLASQSVLEGLNACFDHRAEVYVAELGRTFTVKHEQTKLFACQNPLSQGGGRKGLPKSFLNRFTKVYVDPLTEDDLHFIVSAAYPMICEDVLWKMVRFNTRIHQEVVQKCLWGTKGGPWEFNIRDVLRWCELLMKYQEGKDWNPAEYMVLIYQDRMRILEDKQKVLSLAKAVLDCPSAHEEQLTRLCQFSICPYFVSIGHALLKRNVQVGGSQDSTTNLQLLRNQLAPLESLMVCIDMNWMAILVGPQASGKTSLVQTLAKLTGHNLKTLHMTSSMDTTELLGGFEQVNVLNHMQAAFLKIGKRIRGVLQNELLKLDDCRMALLEVYLDLDQTVQMISVDDFPGGSSSIAESILQGVQKMREKIILACSKSIEDNQSLNSISIMLEEFEETYGKKDLFRKARGCFEWVDGELIHALKNGDWLVIENVNFCSPSVLDRLNALLEPGGVLTVDERGVIDGNIPTIVPHKDFRLILTMDPKYGEISRAMRNRGIEIYIPGEMDGCPLDAIDIRQVIKSAGVKSYNLQSTAMRVLSKMKDFPLKKIAKVCKMLSVLEERTENPDDAVRIAFTEAIKNTKGTEQERQCALQGLQEGLATKGPLRSDEELLHSSSSSINNFCNDSLTSCVWRDTCPLLLTSSHHKIYMCLLMEKASIKDLWTRGIIFRKILDRSQEMNQNMTQLYDKIFSSHSFQRIADLFDEIRETFTTSHASNMLQYLPLQMERYTWIHAFRRYLLEPLGGTPEHDKLQDVMTQLHRMSKRLFQTLYRDFELELMRGTLGGSSNSAAAGSSLLSLSSLFREGHIGMSSLPHDSIAHLQPFFNALDAFCESLQSSNDNNEDVYNVITDKLKWVDRFLHLCSKSVDTSVSPGTFSWHIISLHWKWIKEELLQTLFQTQASSRMIAITKLKVVAEEIDKSLGFDTTSNKYEAAVRNYLGQEIPFRNAEMFEAWGGALQLNQLLMSVSKANSSEIGHNIQDIKTLRRECVKHLERTVAACFGEADKSMQDMKTEIASLSQRLATIPKMNKSKSLLTDVEHGLTFQVQLLYLFTLLRNSSYDADYDESLLAKSIGSFVEFTSSHGSVNALVIAVLNALRAKYKAGEARSLVRTLAMLTLESTFIVPRLGSKEHLVLGETTLDSMKKAQQWNWMSFSITTLISDFIEQNCIISTKPEDFRRGLDWAVDLGTVERMSSDLEASLEFLWISGGNLHLLYSSLLRSMFRSSFEGMLHILRPLDEDLVMTYTKKLENNFLKESGDDLKKQVYLAVIFIEQLQTKISDKDSIQLIVKPLGSVLKMYQTVLEECDDVSLDHENAVKLYLVSGLVVALMGTLIYVAGSPYRPLDPVEEKQEKLKYQIAEMKHISDELTVRYTAEYYWSGSPNLQFDNDVPVPRHLTSNPARVRTLLEKHLALKNSTEDLKSNSAYRPTPSQFENLMRAVKDFQSTVGSTSYILQLIHQALELSTDIINHIKNDDSQNPVTDDNGNKVFLGKTYTVDRMIESWHRSSVSFGERLQKDFQAYQELYGTALLGIAKVNFGFHMVQEGITRYRDMLQWTDTNAFGTKLSGGSSVPVEVVLPPTAPDFCPSILAETMLYCSESLDDNEDVGFFKARVLHLALNHIKMDYLSKGYLSGRMQKKISVLLHQLSKMWVMTKERQKCKEAEESSMFKTRQKTYCEEEENSPEDNDNYLVTFWDDFNDVIPKNDFGNNEENGKKMAPRMEKSVEAIEYINMCDFFETFHDILIKSEQAENLDIRSIFSQTYATWVKSSFGKKAVYAPLTDSKLIASHLIALGSLRREATSEVGSNATDSTKFNIYADPNVQEVKKLEKLLESFRSRVRELLSVYPEHPALHQILKVIEKISGLPAHSPLMKFVTGLEILLQQSQDWESYASSKVSIKSELEQITEQVIEWRKMELRCWPNLLETARKTASKKAFDWFPSLLALIDHSGSAEISKEDLVNMGANFQKFIQSSSIGEFESRLVLLSAIRAYVEALGYTNLGQILWNLYNYYEQFVAHVQSHISTQRKPIEKELKDFVKIMRWNDINFWAMKQATEKSHRTLRKYIRRFEDVLSQPLAPHLKPDSVQRSRQCHEGKDWLRNLSPKNFVVDVPNKKDTTCKKEKETDLGITRERLFVKTRRKCIRFLKQASHRRKVETLDNFVGDVIETVKDLSETNIESLPKEKRSEAIKSLQNRKRRGLHTLFKNLASIGLSYRKGVTLYQGMATELDIMMPTIDTSKLSQWSGIKKVAEESNSYLYEGLVKFSDFNAALASPSKELNPPEIARFKGFATHLLYVVNRQRVHLNDYLVSMRTLRFYIDELKRLDSCHTSLIPHPTEALNLLVATKNILEEANLKLEGFNLLLQCVPSRGNGQSPLPHNFVYPAMFWNQQNTAYQQVVRMVKEYKIKTSSWKSKVDVLVIPAVEKTELMRKLLTWPDVDTALQVDEFLQSLLAFIEDTLGEFTSSTGQCQSTFCESLNALKKLLVTHHDLMRNSEVCKYWTLLNEDAVKEEDVGTMEADNSLSNAVSAALFGIQQLIKFQDQLQDKSGTLMPSSSENAPEHGHAEEDDEEFSQDDLEGLLIPQLSEHLVTEVSSMEVTKVTERVCHVIDDVFNDHNASLHFKTPKFRLQDIRASLPILYQYLCMVEYFAVNLVYSQRTTAKMFSVHVGIFAQLVKEGFCTPPEELEASGEGATEFEDIKGGGIGEGEGVKDVSNEIEDESQLEDTQKDTEDKQDDDDQPDIPDEQEGIEMSEDFDGKLHDVDDDADSRKGSDDEGEEDKEDLDKAAGKLEGEEEEKLDEKFWGDSGDESDLNEDEDETKGPGADAKTESQLVAKDDVQGEQEGKETENMEGQEEPNDHEQNMESENMDVDDVDDEQEAKKDFEIPEDLNLDEMDGTDDAEQAEFHEGENGKLESDVEEDDAVDNDNTEEENGTKEEETDKTEPIPDDEAEKEPASPKQDNQNDEPNDEKDDVPETKSNKDDKQETSPMEAEPAGNMDITAPSSVPSDERKDEQRSEGAGGTAYENQVTDAANTGSDLSQSSLSREAKNSRKDFGRSREDRSLADSIESEAKRQKTTDASSEMPESEDNTQEKAGLYSHIGDNEDWDEYALDTATREQAKKQNLSPTQDQGEDESGGEEGEEIPRSYREGVFSSIAGKEYAEKTDEQDMVVEDSAMEESEADKEEEDAAASSTHGSFAESFFSSGTNFEERTDTNLEELRNLLEHQLAVTPGVMEVGTEKEAMERWMKYEILTTGLAQQLCEQLRLVLEPTQASKLQGDYRTGKRLNMRKVIPYIASQFRKDKIWLRRTKKSKRNYQVMLAVDDSSSMSDNHSKQIAFESLAVISNALTWLEVGELSVCRFGETVELIHQFQDTFDAEAGARVLHRFTFEQSKTQVALLLNTCTNYLASERIRFNQSQSVGSRISQLLLIISDGRGIFLEGKDVVRKAIRVAHDAGIFIVFIIMDSPSNRDSILDIKVPIFSDGKLEIKSYMEEFPFPYYLVLSNINALPNVLGDALRQWFEIVAAEH